jgi:hypothetical protein
MIKYPFMFFIVFLLIFSGCSSVNKSNVNKLLTNNATIYNVRPFTIIVLEPEKLNSIASNYFDFPVYGFYIPHKRTIYVPYSLNTNQFTGNKLPDMYILGHEILHLQEIEGSWHK